MTRRAAALLGQLSLFDEPAGAPVVAAPASASREVPIALRHPRTTHEVRLGEHIVGFALRRARRRSIGMVVAADGLSVAAPRWVTLADIDAALQEKASWIVRKLAEQRDRLQRREAARIEWRDGAAVPFLGRTLTVVLDAGVAGALLDADAATLRLGLPPNAQALQIRDAVQGWLQRQARRLFEERCAHYAERLGVRVRRLALSSAQTRWGSANANGAVRLNWRLVHFGLPTIDYVVAHELAHLREMNHSPRFWDVVRSVMPDYERARDTLSDDVLPFYD